MPTLTETIALATYLHEGVNDLTGTPYIEHPPWVMRALPADASDDDRHLALLHDTVEDCRVRLAILMNEMGLVFDASKPMAYLDFFRRRGYSDYVIEGLILLTRDMWSGSYALYLQNIVESGHRGAMLVKYADLCHNSDPDRLAKILPVHQHKVAKLAARYQRGKPALAKALGIDPAVPLIVTD